MYGREGLESDLPSFIRRREKPNILGIAARRLSSSPVALAPAGNGGGGGWYLSLNPTAATAIPPPTNPVCHLCCE